MKLTELIHWLADLFDKHGVAYSFGGAIARNYYAVPRLTRDIDVLALISQLAVPRLLDDLEAAGASSIVVDPQSGAEIPSPIDLRRILDDLRSGARMTRLLCFGIRVELFTPWHPFDHEVLRRALTKKLNERDIKVHSAEDIIVYKKVFNRSKDVEDIKAILVAQAGKLDLERIRAGAGQLLPESEAGALDELIALYAREAPPG